MQEKLCMNNNIIAANVPRFLQGGAPALFGIDASKVEELVAFALLARITLKALASAANSRAPIREPWLKLSQWIIDSVQGLLDEPPICAVVQKARLPAKPTRVDIMVAELLYAMSNTSADDMRTLVAQVAVDLGTAVGRRAVNLLELFRNLLFGAVSESVGLVKAYADDRAVAHLAQRLGAAKSSAQDALKAGAEALWRLFCELKDNPSEAAPKLLVLVLASVAASGGMDGNGGVPDLDIPLMGIGAHRSPFTHSIIIGSLLETALMLLTRIVLISHKNLPNTHDPLWDGIVRQSVMILKAAGKGASIGIAYHLMVDAVVQPGTYHDIPFDMPLEAHQATFAANSVAEGLAAKSHPEEEKLKRNAEDAGGTQRKT